MLSAFNPRPIRTATTAIALLAMSVGACSDSNDPLPAEATFTGRWAGRPWVGEASATLVDGGEAGDTLYIFGSRPVNAGQMPLEYIRISVLFRGTHEYALASGTTDRAELVELTGGDVVHASYTLAEGSSGTLRITSWGGPGGEVEGRVSFMARSDSPYRSYGAVEFFTDGQFRATINTYP